MDEDKTIKQQLIELADKIDHYEKKYGKFEEPKEDKVKEAKLYRKYFEMLRDEDNKNIIDIEYSFRNKVGGGRMTTCSSKDCKECEFYRDLYISAMAYGMLREHKNQSQTKENILKDFTKNDFLNIHKYSRGEMKKILDKHIGGKNE